MLDELRLRGLGAIDHAELTFHPGFTAITGETGAGKTMLLTGLALLLGERADSGAVAGSAERLEVDGRFTVVPDSPPAQRVIAAGGTVDDGELLLSRTVGRDGRSRAHAGGRPVPAGLLAELGEDLVTVHGQADQRGLLRSPVQRAALDRYAADQLGSLAETYRGGFEELRQLNGELLDVTARARERAREADLLRLGLAEIQAVVPQPGEDAELQALIARLAHVDGLRMAAGTAAAELIDDTGERPAALDRLAAARRALDAVVGHDRELDALATRLAEATYQLSDVASDVSSYLVGLDADPQRLEASQQRLAALRGLTRKYGEDTAAVIDWARTAAERLATLDGDDDRIQQLAERREALVTSLATDAAGLSRIRHDAAERLAASVGAELQALAMPGASLHVEVRQREDPDGLPVDGRRVAFGSHGIDEVEFLLAAHPGATPRPLHRGASGGELSRVMLALEVVLAHGRDTPTYVFDEVDAGVGGRAAVEIGRRLGALARSAQVVVVTHLAQVAAFADQHLVVRKEVSAAGARTSVDEVTDSSRVTELSRMLAGVEDSEHGRGHATELLELAAAARG